MDEKVETALEITMLAIAAADKLGLLDQICEELNKEIKEIRVPLTPVAIAGAAAFYWEWVKAQKKN